ncbi:MAG: hypothetical protein L6Q92_11110 [Phycisphaerae bacterium]|nr:hypothetical protein [Phycisphaerae bacterium]
MFLFLSGAFVAGCLAAAGGRAVGNRATNVTSIEVVPPSRPFERLIPRHV